MDPVLENVLVELLVDLPADADIPVVASGPEQTWLWSDLHLSEPSRRRARVVGRSDWSVRGQNVSGRCRSGRPSWPD